MSTTERATAPLRIGEVAGLAGVNIPTLRYYERRGLIAPERRYSGQRVYELDAVRLVQAIKIAQGLGFSLAEIEEIVRSSAEGDAGARLRSLAADKVAEIDARIESLRAARSSLTSLVELSCTSLSDCSCPPACPVSPDHRPNGDAA